MKNQLLLLVMMLLPMVVSAGDVVEVDGIYYNLIEKSKEAEVTKNPNGNYRISVDIPAYFEYGGESYRVYSIGYSAFQNCKELYSVTIPNTVTSIGMNAFRSSGITSIDIPNGVTYIGKYAFCMCTNMKSVSIPNSVTTIEEGAFELCSSLSTLDIPSNITGIGSSVFSKCSGLVSVTIPNSVTSIGWHAFDYCSSLTSITIPSNVTTIGDFAFMGCSSLKSIIIPNKVSSIGTSAFQYCNKLTSVTIGSNVKRVDSKSFADCTELANVYCYAKNVPGSIDYYGNNATDAFAASHIEDIILHVPIASVNLYKTVEPWKNFKSIVGLESETPKCELPTISYENGKLKFGCTTEGTEYVYEITDTDIGKGYTNEVQLSATYTISVYATKLGYDNSDIATAILCWIDTTPQTEGITEETPTDVMNVKAMPVLIQQDGNYMTISGTPAGTPIRIYDLSGRIISSATAVDGVTRVRCSSSEKVVIVKVDERSVKVAQ